MRLPFTKRRQQAPEPPPGWHADPENPARSVHEPRSGTATTNTTFHAGGAYGRTGGAGGMGNTPNLPPSRGGTGGPTVYMPIEMPPCPVCGRPVPGTGSPCRHGGSRP
jgi:hypothetical protein